MEQVTEALQTAHSPTAPEPLRAQALQLLSEFQQSDACGDWAFAVLNQPPAQQGSAEARHFALQCLAALLKHKWKGWTPQVREQFRRAVVGLMDGMAPAEPTFMRERVALLVSGVGERDFPQAWPSMLGDLATVWETRGPGPVVTALTALRNVAEDCVDSDFNARLPTNRRTDILKQLNGELPEILPRLFQVMARTYEGRQADPATAAEVLKAALQLLKRLVLWVSPDLLMRPEVNFLQVFCILMGEEPTRKEACECLRDLGNRKFESLAQAQQYLEQLQEAVMQLVPQGQVWQDLALGETICATLAGFLAQNLERLVTEDAKALQPGTREQQRVAGALQLMTELLRLPSLRAAAALVPGWLLIVKLEKLKGLQVVEPLLPHMLGAYCDKSVKLRYDEEGGSFPDSPVADEEFIDLEEYMTFFSTLKANAMTIIKSTAETYPQQAVAFLKERLPALVARFGACKGVAVQDEAYRQFEGLVNPLDRVLTSLPEPRQDKEEDVALVQSVSWLLSVLLEWQVSDPLLLYCHCLLLEGFKRFYRYFDQQLWAVLERLFQYMEYRDPALVGQAFPNASQLMKKLSNEALQVRRRGSNSLTEICNNVPDIVVPFLGELCTRCRGLIVKGEVSDSQRPQLIEMLVVVANALPDPQQRMAFIQELVADSEAYWENPSTSQALASVPAFLGLLGVGADGSVPTTEAQWDEAYDRAHALLGALNTFLGVTRRLKVPTQDDISSKDPRAAAVAKALITEQLSLEALAEVNPFVPIWGRILPNLLQLLRVLHGMWAPDVRATLAAHPEARHLLSLNDDEVQSRVKAGGQRPPQLSSTQVAAPVRRWPLWLNQIRQSAYQMLEKACHHKVMYYSTDTLMAVREAVVEALPLMDHRHVPWFTKSFVEPYVINCPFPLFASHLPPILAPYMHHMLLRCSVTWNGLPPTPDPTAPPDPALAHLVDGGTFILWEGLSKEDYETVLDKLRREVTRSYVEMLQTGLALRGGMIQALVESNKVLAHQHHALTSAAAGASGGKKGEGGGNGGGLAAGEQEGSSVHSSSVTNSGAGGGGENGGGKPSPPCTVVKEFVDALCRFLVVDCDALAVPLFLSVLGALCWQDQHAARRAVHVAQKMMEVGVKEPKLYPAFGRDMFGEMVRAALAEQTWVLGMQNELLALACEIYRALVIGESEPPMAAGLSASQGSSSGPGTPAPSPAPSVVDGVSPDHSGGGGGGKRARPLRPALLLCEYPRQVLLSLPGMTPEAVLEMEAKMLRTFQAKEQREYFKEMMRQVAEAMGDEGGAVLAGPAGPSGNGAAGGSNPQAKKEESVLRGGGPQRRSRGRSGSFGGHGGAALSDLSTRLIRRGQALSGGKGGGEEVELQASVAALFGAY